MLGICKIYPEMGPLDEIDKCYSFSVFDIRKSDIACGNCQNWIAADSVSIGQLVAMMFNPDVSDFKILADKKCPRQPNCPACSAWLCNGPVNGVCAAMVDVGLLR